MSSKTTSVARYPRHSRSEWKDIVKRFSKSKLSIEQFCQQESILPVTLRKWQCRFKSASLPDSFVEITSANIPPPTPISSPSSSGHWDIELELGHGMVLRLRRA